MGLENLACLLFFTAELHRTKDCRQVPAIKEFCGLGAPLLHLQIAVCGQLDLRASVCSEGSRTRAS